jgi:hypothetical protein
VVPVTPVQTSGVSPINLTSFVFVTMAEDRQWDFKFEDLPHETMASLAAISMAENQRAVFAEYQKSWHQKWDNLPGFLFLPHARCSCESAVLAATRNSRLKVRVI